MADILFSESFDSLGDYINFTSYIHTEYKSDYMQGVFNNDSGFISVLHKGNEIGSDRVLGEYYLRRASSSVLLSFDVYFPANFNWGKGGKLNGLGPEKVVAGGYRKKIDGWSARLMFEADGVLASYNYFQNRSKKYGEGLKSSKNVLKKGMWNSIQYYLKLNTTEELGSYCVFVNNQLVVEEHDLVIRGVKNEALISKFLFHTFYGGARPDWAPIDSDGNIQTMTISFDNIIVTDMENVLFKCE